MVAKSLYSRPCSGQGGYTVARLTRVQRDTFSIKQDDLAKMLGVRRSSVGQVCGELQRVGIIRV